MLVLVVPHSKRISSLKPPHLLQHAVFRQSSIFYPVDYAIPDTIGF